MSTQPQFAFGSHFFASWTANQRATDEAVEEHRRQFAACPLCGATYLVRYGRHESAYFVIHPLGNCPLAFDSHHAGAQTEKQALELFSQREEMPQLTRTLPASEFFDPLSVGDSQSEEEALYEAQLADRGIAAPEEPFEALP